MVRIGYTLSSEEHGPQELTKNAELAEKAGFSFLMISDHFHPWVEEQGESPFVWSVLGAISQKTKKVNVGIGVLAPIIRYHPAIVAQAAATTQSMFEGRFILGVGTGENLNEHVVGEGWPPTTIRREMLNEAIEIMRRLWDTDGYVTYQGDYFFIDSAKIYSKPTTTIPILYSAFGPISAESAGTIGDGFITTSPDEELIGAFRQNGGKGKPIYGQFHVCYDTNKERAKKTVERLWPNSAMPKPLATNLKSPDILTRSVS